MGFNIMLLVPPSEIETDVHDRYQWTKKLENLIPDVQVTVALSQAEAKELIPEADAAYGDIVPEVFMYAKRLKWIACPHAGPKSGYYHQDLIESDVTVTNTRGIYPFISIHIMALVMAFARDIPTYLHNQLEGKWDPVSNGIYLPHSTVVVVGVGGIGAETARICSEFGINVIGVDPRIDLPPPGVSDLRKPDEMHAVLPLADFVVLTVPETPQTIGFFGENEFRLMKSTAYLINIGRGANVKLNELNTALRCGDISGAGLDVFETEPLPSDHPLWSAPGMIITPHVAADPGPDLDEHRTNLFLDNCMRFNDGRPLRNVVDKAMWY